MVFALNQSENHASYKGKMVITKVGGHERKMDQFKKFQQIWVPYTYRQLRKKGQGDLKDFCFF